MDILSQLQVVEVEHVLARRPGLKVDGDMVVIPSHRELRRRADAVEVATDLDNSAPMLKICNPALRVCRGATPRSELSKGQRDKRRYSSDADR
ncbi:hypothetical protein FVER53590_25960 [Fusarium verticillioides]|nr:hypothetical protein FVER53590_25960 [Fusarium verticillioides]